MDGWSIMHIPDGYLSPQTCAVGFAVAVPAIAVAATRVKRVVKTRHVPHAGAAGRGVASW